MNKRLYGMNVERVVLLLVQSGRRYYFSDEVRLS